MILLTLRDLQHRKLRFLVVTLLTAVVLALLFVMTGLVEQFHREPYDTVNGFGADAWVLPDGAPGLFTGLSVLPASTLAAVDAAVKAPVVIAQTNVLQGDRSTVMLAGVVPGPLGPPPLTGGRAVAADGEVVVDESLGVSIGETITVGGTPLTVVGRTFGRTVLAGVPMAYVSLAQAQAVVFHSTDVISAVLVDGQPSTLPAGTHAVAAEDVAADVLKPLKDAISSVDFVRLLLWVVTAVIIGAVVYLSALERQRDFAVLKAVGTSNRSLMIGLALQALLVALVAVALASLLQAIIAPNFPMRVRVPVRAFVQLPLVACFFALLAAAAGIRRAATADPVSAFNGAGA